MFLPPPPSLVNFAPVACGDGNSLARSLTRLLLPRDLHCCLRCRLRPDEMLIIFMTGAGWLAIHISSPLLGRNCRDENIIFLSKLVCAFVRMWNVVVLRHNCVWKKRKNLPGCVAWLRPAGRGHQIFTALDRLAGYAQFVSVHPPRRREVIKDDRWVSQLCWNFSGKEETSCPGKGTLLFFLEGGRESKLRRKGRKRRRRGKSRKIAFHKAPTPHRPTVRPTAKTLYVLGWRRNARADKRTNILKFLFH